MILKKIISKTVHDYILIKQIKIALCCRKLEMLIILRLPNLKIIFELDTVAAT